MYQDARIAFIVILALIVFIVIVWGQNPSPDDVLMESGPSEEATEAVARAAAPGPPPASAAEESRHAAPSDTFARAEDTQAGASSSLPAARAETVPGSPSRPHFPFPPHMTEGNQSDNEATVVHTGPPPKRKRVAARDAEAKTDSAGNLPAAPPAADRGDTTQPPPAAKKTYHVVVKGDNYRKLARQYYQDESRWTDIYKANNVPPERLLIGTKLLIPELPDTRSATAAPKAQDSPATGVRSYTVKKGDNFYRIALRIYHEASLWKKLYEHNRDRLPNPSDPSSLRAGMTIELPQLASAN